MPIYTFYVYKPPKNRRVPVYTTSEEPCDWANLRTMLLEVAIITWNEHHLAEFLVSLEKHLSGAYNMKWRRSGYSPRRVFYKRQPEFFCRIMYNPLNRQIKIRQASFGPSLLAEGFLDDYKSLEKGVKYQSPTSCVPLKHKNLSSDPKSLCLEPSQSFHSDYSRKEVPNYRNAGKLHLKRQTYDRTASLSYLPKNAQIAAEESEENEDQSG